jgi:transmembrane sensor
VPPYAPLDRSTLEAAATWYVDLRMGTPCESILLAHRKWLESDPRHRQAWERVDRLQATLGRVSPDIASPTLHSAQVHRRSVLKVLSLLLVSGGAGTLVWRTTPLPDLMADLATGTGEHREIRLEDGSRLQLDTATAVNLRLTAQLREVHLLHGAIAIQTAKDRRPFIVHTDQGSIRALGTQFVVRSAEGNTRVSVQQHAVEVRPAMLPDTPVVLPAGQQLSFTAHHVQRPQTADPQVDAWTRGVLVASNWRLDDFLAELQRYRPGYVECAPGCAGLRVSGAFFLGDTDRVLQTLAQSFPIKVRSFTRYWVRVQPV